MAAAIDILKMICAHAYHNQCDQMGDLLDFGQFLKTLATINLPKSPTFLGNF